MFSNGEKRSVAKRSPPTPSNDQRETTRGLPTPNLFSVPEDREVLRTPSENQYSGFVFGQGMGSKTTEVSSPSVIQCEDTPTPAFGTARITRTSPRMGFLGNNGMDSENETIANTEILTPQVTQSLPQIFASNPTETSFFGASSSQTVPNFSNPMNDAANLPHQSMMEISDFDPLSASNHNWPSSTATTTPPFASSIFRSAESTVPTSNPSIDYEMNITFNGMTSEPCQTTSFPPTSSDGMTLDSLQPTVFPSTNGMTPKPIQTSFQPASSSGMSPDPMRSTLCQERASMDISVMEEIQPSSPPKDRDLPTSKGDVSFPLQHSQLESPMMFPRSEVEAPTPDSKKGNEDSSVHSPPPKDQPDHSLTPPIHVRRGKNNAEKELSPPLRRNRKREEEPSSPPVRHRDQNPHSDEEAQENDEEEESSAKPNDDLTNALDPLSIQMWYDRDGRLRDALHESSWNPMHGYAVPDMTEFIEMERQRRINAEAYERQKEEEESESETEEEAYARRISVVPRASYEMVKSQTPGKHWTEIVKESREKERKEREEVTNALKRLRERTEEGKIWEPREERESKKAATEYAKQILEKNNSDKRGVSIDGKTEEEIQKLLPRMPRNRDYYLVPTMDDLRTMIIAQGSGIINEVPNVKFGHKRFGYIQFDKPFNLENVDFEKEIKIKHGHIEGLEIERLKQTPVTVTLFAVKRRLHFDVYEITKQSLEELCDQRPGFEFLSYNNAGTWKFRVEDLAAI